MFRLVIADDEETIRNGLKKLIESYNIGIKIVAMAEDGEEAISIIKEHKPEIILMDINMPFVNGLESIEKVKNLVPNSKIIIISGYDKFDYAKKALELGVFNYLLKPINYRDFKDVLLKAIDSYKERMWEISQLNDKSNILEKPKDVPNESIEYIKKSFTNKDLSLKSVAEDLFISQSYLTKVIKDKTGSSFTDYLNKLRIDMAINLLLNKEVNYSIKEISDMVGYNSQHYFSRAFKNYMGMSPIQYKNKFLKNN